MPAELFLVAAFGRESSAREDGEGKLSDEKVPGGLDNNYLQSRGQLKDKETVGELTRGLR